MLFILVLILITFFGIYKYLSRPHQYALLLMTYNNPQRSQMYEDVIRWWMRNSSIFDIYVVDSGNHPFPKDIESRCNVFHFDQNKIDKNDLTFFKNTCGYPTSTSYELISLEKATEYFKFKNYDMVFKLTAKYKLPTLEESVAKLPKSKYVLQRAGNNDWQPCEIYGIKGTILKRTIKDLKSVYDDEKPVLENKIPQVVKKAKRLPKLKNLASYKRASGDHLHYL